MSKKFILVYILLTPIVLFSQTWKTESGGNDFDGKYKLAYVQGVGEEFPYNEPLMAFIKWDNQEDYSLYIKDADFLQPDTGIEIIFVFDNEPGVLYRTYPSSLSADGKTSFFNGFTNSQDLVNYSKYEILQKLMTASSVSVRFSDRFGQNDTKFNLSGSTKAINYVLPESEMNVLIEKAINDRNEELADEQKKIDLLSSFLESMKSISLSNTSLITLESEIKRDLGINYPLKESYADEIVSIKYKADFESSLFKNDSRIDILYVLEDGTEKEIFGRWIINSDSKVFDEAKKAEEEKLAATQVAVENIKDILKKYVFQEIIDEILIEVAKQEERWSGALRNSWNYLDIKDIKVVFEKNGVIGIDSITIYLKDGREEKYNVYSSTIIKNRDFKQIGATLGELF